MIVVSTEYIEVSPVKEFFVEMITKDITVFDSILDLIDNCIDGARRKCKSDNYEQFQVNITLDKDKFSIKDNCGGIPLITAKEYAFKFGRPKNTPQDVKSIGRFGIGMKRAFFRLGKKIYLETGNTHDGYSMDIDVDKWIEDSEWKFELNKSDEFKDLSGTNIIIKNLHVNVSNEFKDSSKIRRLIEEISDRLYFYIKKGFNITVNGSKVKAKSIEMIVDRYRLFNDNYEYTVNNERIEARIIAGLANKGKPEEAGWYVDCNGRRISSGNKEIGGLGRGEGSVVYNNLFAGFRGYVSFESENIALLPVTTTKSGIDKDNIIFRKLELEMKKVFNQIKKVVRDETDSAPDDIEGRNFPYEGGMKEVDLLVNEVPKSTTFATIVPIVKTHENIAFKVDKERFEIVKDKLGARNKKQVGEQVFDYYYDMEC